LRWCPHQNSKTTKISKRNKQETKSTHTSKGDGKGTTEVAKLQKKLKNKIEMRKTQEYYIQ